MPSRDQMIVDLSTKFRNKQDFEFAKYKKKVKSQTTQLLTREYNILILGKKRVIVKKPTEKKGGSDGTLQDRPRKESDRKRVKGDNS